MSATLKPHCPALPLRHGLSLQPLRFASPRFAGVCAPPQPQGGARPRRPRPATRVAGRGRLGRAPPCGCGGAQTPAKRGDAKRSGCRLKPWRRGRAGQCGFRVADKALSSPRRRPVSASHLAGLGGDHHSRRPSIAAAAASPKDAAAAAVAAAAVSAAGKRPHPFLPFSRGGKNPGKMLRERALQEKKSPAVVSERCWELAFSLSPPSDLAAPPSSAPRQPQNLGPRWVQVPGSL